MTEILCFIYKLGIIKQFHKLLVGLGKIMLIIASFPQVVIGQRSDLVSSLIGATLANGSDN